MKEKIKDELIKQGRDFIQKTGKGVARGKSSAQHFMNDQIIPSVKKAKDQAARADYQKLMMRVLEIAVIAAPFLGPQKAFAGISQQLIRAVTRNPKKAFLLGAGAAGIFYLLKNRNEAANSNPDWS